MSSAEVVHRDSPELETLNTERETLEPLRP
jgi:hypothetical protein